MICIFEDKIIIDTGDAESYPETEMPGSGSATETDTNIISGTSDAVNGSKHSDYLLNCIYAEMMMGF